MHKDGSDNSELQTRLHSLSSLETEILRQLSDGKKMSGIAASLSLTQQTISMLLASAKNKLRANTTPHAVSMLLTMGNTTPDPQTKAGI